MLSRAKITPGSAAYYCGEIVNGLEDYYAGRSEAPGQWIRSGSAAEELRGTVLPDELARLFAGRHPRTDELLGAAYAVRAGAEAVTGWDLTFSAPKSVSALWATAGAEVAVDVADAHAAAVGESLAYLEAHAGFARAGKGGVRQLDTDGFLAAAFVHRSSRSGDPQLHTHVVISGRLHCADGAWRALDSRALHRELKPAGMLYQACLRAELTERLGVEWASVDRHGQAEIVGVPEGLCRLYSSRRAEVDESADRSIAAREAQLQRRLRAPERRRAYERAVLSTRPPRTAAGCDQGLMDRWREEAEWAGFAPRVWIRDVIGRVDVEVKLNAILDVTLNAGTQRLGRTCAAELLLSESLVELGRTAATWRRCDVVRQITRRLPAAGASASDVRQSVEELADRGLGDVAVVRLSAFEPDNGEHRRDGVSVYEHHGAARYATTESLAAEQFVVGLANAGRAARRCVVDLAAVDAASQSWALSAEQLEAMWALTTSGDVVSCLVGPAGAGKSRTVGAAADAWMASGYDVLALAVSASAAAALSAETGLRADTVAKFLYDHSETEDAVPPVSRHGVIVVDEAAMLSSADLAGVLSLADRGGAKVLLVGDHHQLGAVEAGGLFGVLARDAGTELAEVRRFHADWEAVASLELRQGRTAALDAYESHGRVRRGDDGQMLQAALDEWRDARLAGESIVISAPDHARVDAFCMRARQERVAEGEVESSGLIASNHIVGVGDEIVTTRNDRRIRTTAGSFVRNGDRWRVERRDRAGGLAVTSFDGADAATLPAHYAAHHVALAYATTVHKSQGLTVDRSVLLVDETTTAEALYVGMTRGRRSNIALVISDRHDAPSCSDGPDGPDPLRRALCRSSVEPTGIEVLEASRGRSARVGAVAGSPSHRQMEPDRPTVDVPNAEGVSLEP